MFAQWMDSRSALVVFVLIILGLLALDLGVFNRRDRIPTIKSSLSWTAFWMTLALSFGGLIWQVRGQDAAMTYLTAYLVEQSLSIDNLFVFLLIFTSFKIPTQYQHRVLFWGIIGALAMRAVFIGAGVTLITRFEWLVYALGALLVVMGFKTMFKKDEEDEAPRMESLINFFGRFFRFSQKLDGHNFFTIENGKKAATPLFTALILIEASDVIFAVDSIPAVLGITQDPFLVYTSNVFAVMGLRSIYFALAHVMKICRFLTHGLAVILVFIGGKMLLHHVLPIPQHVALMFVVTVLVLSIVLSLMIPENNRDSGSSK